MFRHSIMHSPFHMDGHGPHMGAHGSHMDEHGPHVGWKFS
jgi:hypothetical protein